MVVVRLTCDHVYRVLGALPGAGEALSKSVSLGR